MSGKKSRLPMGRGLLGNQRWSGRYCKERILWPTINVIPLAQSTSLSPYWLSSSTFHSSVFYMTETNIWPRIYLAEDKARSEIRIVAGNEYLDLTVWRQSAMSTNCVISNSMKWNINVSFKIFSTLVLNQTVVFRIFNTSSVIAPQFQKHVTYTVIIIIIIIIIPNADLFAETEGFLAAIQDQVILTRNYKKYILKQPDTHELCRRCGKESETFQHITAACEQLAPTE